MIPHELVDALTEAFLKTPRDVWRQLAARLTEKSGLPDPSSVHESTANYLSRDAAWILSEAFNKLRSTTWCEISAAMTTLDCLAGDNLPLTEIIWTGPTNNRFPVRRIDQVLYDLIARAQRRIVLVTFAAHRVRHLCLHLSQAVERGVDLTLIFESETESEGQLTRDATAAFRDIPLQHTHIYCWPLEMRERNEAGRPGKLHVKCAIVDDISIIGSANLTDDAFNRNMEMGILIRDPATSFSISEHFRELVCNNVLVEVKREDR